MAIDKAMPQRSHAAWFASLAELPVSMRALLTCFLATIGLGYLAAVYYLFSVDVDPHLKMGMSMVSGIEMKYHGERGNTRLEAALRGVMAGRIGPEHRAMIIGWLRSGAPEQDWAQVKPMLDQSCVACHRVGSGLPIPPLTSYEDVRKVARVDTGPSLADLARVSHIHLFGISLIFMLTGAVFALSRLPTGWKTLFIVLPFVSIWADIGSWWITKYQPVFAYIVLSGGGLMGASLAVQILIPLWEMWLGARSEPTPIRREP